MSTSCDCQTPKELVWTLNKAKLYRYTRSCQDSAIRSRWLVFALIETALTLYCVPVTALRVHGQQVYEHRTETRTSLLR